MGVVAYADSSGPKPLIVCDSNARHICWRSNKCSPRGEKLFNFITLPGLMTANVVCASTFLGNSEVVALTSFKAAGVDHILASATRSFVIRSSIPRFRRQKRSSGSTKELRTAEIQEINQTELCL